MNEGIKILVVEDEIQLRNVICMYLKKEGYTVLETDNGLEALSIAEREIPKLIILDIMLPGLSGYEVCKKLKSDKITKKIIVVILSARGQEWEKMEGYQVGADLYETKPFSPRQLISNINALIQNEFTSI